MRLLLFLSLIIFCYSFWDYHSYDEENYKEIKIDLVDSVDDESLNDVVLDEDIKDEVTDKMITEEFDINQEDTGYAPRDYGNVDDFEGEFLKAVDEMDLNLIVEMWEYRDRDPEPEVLKKILIKNFDYDLIKFFYDEGYPFGELMNEIEQKQRNDGVR